MYEDCGRYNGVAVIRMVKVVDRVGYRFQQQLVSVTFTCSVGGIPLLNNVL